LRAIWAGDGVTLHKVVSEGDLLPTDIGLLRLARPDNGPVFSGLPDLNDQGDIVFAASLSDLEETRIGFGAGVHLNPFKIFEGDVVLTIARDRNTQNEHGEVKRLVNSLLQLIDNSTSNGLFIAATNHEKLLDSAIWRRFDEVLFFDNPSIELRTALLSRYLSAIRYSGIDLSAFAARIENATGADIERICADAIKSVILRGDRILTADDLEVAIGRYLDRQRIISNSTEFSTSSQNGESV
jgi:hypothetical protein